MTTSKIDATDREIMRSALALARRGLGNVWPNPAVGCILLHPDLNPHDGGMIVGRGWTQPSGRPHAEAEALQRAGPLAAGATAYVTLEPCAHHGETLPCAEALAAAGVRRVVIAMEDPDPRVSGAGIRHLKEAGMKVTMGVDGTAAAELNAGFVSRNQAGRPLITWKTATGLDSRVATASGHSQWITGEAARARGHLMRARHDAILIGIETALADKARLTCRLPGMAKRSPVRVVLDSRLRMPLDHPLVAGAGDTPTWIYTVDGADQAQRENLEASGVEVLTAEADKAGRPDVLAVAHDLGSRGITRLLVEGGPSVASSFIQRDLIDRVCWFRAPLVMGGDGRAAVDGLGIETIAGASAFERVATIPLGPDSLETYRRASHS